MRKIQRQPMVDTKSAPRAGPMIAAIAHMLLKRPDRGARCLSGKMSPRMVKTTGWIQPAPILQGAKGDQPDHGGASRTKGGSDDEHDDPDEQNATAAVEVSKATPKRHGGGGGDEITGDDPGIKLETAEIASDGGQGSTNDGCVHGRNKERDHKPRHNAIELRRPGNALKLNAHVFRLPGDARTGTRRLEPGASRSRNVSPFVHGDRFRGFWVRFGTSKCDLRAVSATEIARITT